MVIISFAISTDNPILLLPFREFINSITITAISDGVVQRPEAAG